MMRRGFLTLVVLALLAAQAFAQAQLPEHVYQTLVEVCEAYPYPVVQSDEHLGEILNEVAYRHRAEGWGLSRKTGGRRVDSPVGEIAEDILQLPNGNHYDVLGAAAKGNPLQPGRSANIGTINLNARPWVAPVAHRLSWLGGHTPPPVDPTPVVTPPPPPAVPVDLAPVLAALARVEARLAVIEARPVPEPVAPDLGMVHEYIDDMVGNGPGGASENHVTDLKLRLDVLRVTLEQLNAWLRSRPVLRF